jgi:magnesium-transporting ATPase (P-type)
VEVLRGNRVVWWSAVALIVVQLGYCYLPIINAWFGSAPIGLREWLLTAVLAVVIFLLAEVAKVVTRARRRTDAGRQPAAP